MAERPTVRRLRAVATAPRPDARPAPTVRPKVRQEDVYRFIVRYLDAYGYAPTVREIKDEFDLGSTNTADYHLTKLEEQGRIRRGSNRSRAIEIVDRDGPRDGGPKGARLLRLPVRGLIAAGLPIDALDDRDEYVDVAESLVGTPEAYALQVRGTSMIDEHICDGDYVVIRPQATARNGEIVVALLADNGVTLKKFYHEGTHIRLQPANAKMAPIIIPAGEDIRIQGTVRAVIRQVG